ncbi:MAG: restriction endonuclease subunit S [Pleomorphochaeta sp.]
MSKLDELINELCPDGVEYKKLGEICNVKSGGTPKKNKIEYWEKGTIKWLGSSVCKNEKFVASITNYITEEGLNNSSTKLFGKNTTLIALVGATIGKVSYLQFEASINQNIAALYPKDLNYLNSDYLFYSCQILYKKFLNLANSGFAMASLSFVRNLYIPIPPLPIQEEIVRILDTFTELTAELTAELTVELTARKKQYEYYRDKLLNFDDSVEWKELGEISTEMYRGAGIKRDQVTPDGIPCVRYGEIYTKYNIWFEKCFSHTTKDVIKNKKYFEYGDVLFAITGESVEEIAKSCVYVGNKKCLAGGDMVVMKHEQNPKYLAYALSTTNARIQKSKGRVKSKVVHSNVDAIKKIKIPVPPLAEQERIVKILDKFDTLTNDITKGLPAEIEARQKQYEYYRDKLLTFKEKKA